MCSNPALLTLQVAFGRLRFWFDVNICRQAFDFYDKVRFVCVTRQSRSAWISLRHKRVFSKCNKRVI